jgi:hypothetical protein
MSGLTVRLGFIDAGGLLLFDGNIYVKCSSSYDMVALSDIILIDGKGQQLNRGKNFRVSNDTMVEPLIGDFYTCSGFVFKTTFDLEDF